MNSLTQLNRPRRNWTGRISSGQERPLQTFPPERYSGLVRRRGGLISVPGKLKSAISSAATSQKLTKLLLNVNIERSLGPVQVVTKPDNTVSDLIKAAIEIYIKEKRRPLLKETDPKFFALHYSQFSLESLKADEKLKNLGSRNFFLCSKPFTPANTSSCTEELMCLADLEFDYINPYDSSSRINKVVLPEFITEGLLCVFFLITGHWFMSLLCAPYLYYNVTLYTRRQHLVDVTEIFNQLHWEKKQRLFKLAYLIFLLFLSIFWMIWCALDDHDE